MADFGTRRSNDGLTTGTIQAGLATKSRASSRASLRRMRRRRGGSISCRPAAAPAMCELCGDEISESRIEAVSGVRRAPDVRQAARPGAVVGAGPTAHTCTPGKSPIRRSSRPARGTSSSGVRMAAVPHPAIQRGPAPRRWRRREKSSGRMTFGDSRLVNERNANLSPRIPESLKGEVRGSEKWKTTPHVFQALPAIDACYGCGLPEKHAVHGYTGA